MATGFREAGFFLNRRGKSIIGLCLAALIFFPRSPALAQTPIIGHHRLMVLENASFDEKGEILLPDGGKARLSGIDLPEFPPGGGSVALEQFAV